MRSREATIAAAARALGFSRAGTAPLAPLPVGPFLQAWLAEGRAGEMGSLAGRTAERIDPRAARPWARAVISLAYPYRPPPPPPGDWRATLTGRIAAYALGEDYHARVGALLDALAARLAAAFPGARFQGYVDTGPVLEREWAMRAGLGWIGKHTLLLDRAAGSYFFLAELFTDLELAASPLPADHCGTCARCHAACPTGALGPGYTMDPRRCLSYLTIEHRSALPVELPPRPGNWIFGRDPCQDASPWNGEARAPAARRRGARSRRHGRGRRTAARRRSSRRRSLHDPGAPRAVDRRAVGALLCTDVQVDALMADPTESRALRTLVDIVESGRPLVYIRSAEEQRVTTLLREIAGRCFSSAVPLWTWSLTEGMRRDDGTGGELLGPRAALDFVATYDGRALFLFKDFHEPMREAPDVRRRLRDLYELCFSRGKVLIICSPVKFIPEEIERAIVYVELAVPDLDELVG